MIVSNILIILNTIALIITLIWYKRSDELEPLAGSLTLIGTLVVQVFYKYNKDSGKSTMQQKGGNGSNNYQAGNDINVNKP